MGSLFGQYVAKARTEAGKSLREIARSLEVSSTYLFDMEEGRRNPPTADKVVRLAKILGLDYDELNRLASLSRKSVELPIGGEGSSKDELAVILARSWDGLTEDQIQQLRVQLGRSGE